MSRNLLVGALVCVLSGTVVFHASPSAAQRVWVGGGGVRVRAPFVRVDVGPNGGVSVRAPFTAVDVPPRGYHYEPDYPPPRIERRMVEPQFPTAAELAGMDDAQLNQSLRAIAQSLHNRLRRFDTGHTWQRYLNLPEEVVAEGTPPDVRGAAIAELLERFHRVEADPQYAMIARLSAIRAMVSALDEAFLRVNASTSGAARSEELPLPPQPLVPPQQPQPQLPPPQRPTDADHDGPFLKPRQPR